MPKKKMWVEWDDGSELSHSRKQPGKSSPLTRDEEGNLSQVVLEDIDDDDLASDDDWAGSPSDPGSDEVSELTLVVAQAVADVITEVVIHLAKVAIDESTPHVKKWWAERGRPTIATAKDSVRRRLSRAPKDDGEVEPAGATEGPASSSTTVGVELYVEKASITAEEARQLLVAALAARAISDQLFATLANVTVDDPEGALDPAGVVDQLEPAHAQEQLELLLAANPSFLDDFVQQFLTEGRADDALVRARSDEATALPPAGPS